MTHVRQFVAVAFRPGDTRTYTYHHDGERLAIGDRVVVSTNRGPSTVTVAELLDAAPSFATKPIVGKERAFEPIDPERTPLAADANPF